VRSATPARRLAGGAEPSRSGRRDRSADRTCRRGARRSHGRDRSRSAAAFLKSHAQPGSSTRIFALSWHESRHRCGGVLRTFWAAIPGQFLSPTDTKRIFLVEWHEPVRNIVLSLFVQILFILDRQYFVVGYSYEYRFNYVLLNYMLLIKIDKVIGMRLAKAKEVI
jgi:hypothetical protein